MLILAIDTSTSAIAVGLTDGAGHTTSAARVDPRGHTEHLAPLVAQLLVGAGVTPGELTGIVVGTGPGPFTGLRVGMVTGLTMGLATGIPVHGVCSLDALASQSTFRAGDELLVATDARRNEVYWAHYRVIEGGIERLGGPAVDLPAEVPEELRRLPTAGRGPLLYPAFFPVAVEPLDVDAGVMAELGARGIEHGWPMPVDARYLRRPDALTTAERNAR
ncbi:MAG: tRNA (adenosine(37)-N6)-threonylcarbamoyltransferase complex dimerization subunit type 1 TsaB [Ornithinibacter sp.]